MAGVFVFHGNRHKLERFQIRLLVRHLDATDELHALPDRRNLLQFRHHLRLDDVIQRGGNIIELLRVRIAAGVEQARAVAHRVAKHQPERHGNIHVAACRFQG